MGRKKKCIVCGKEFETQYNSSKYCSSECAKVGYNEKRKQKRHKHKAQTEGVPLSEIEGRLYGVRVCARVGCSNEFIPKNFRQKFCSAECAKLYKRNRRTEEFTVNRVPRMCKYDFVQKLKRDLLGLCWEE